MSPTPSVASYLHVLYLRSLRNPLSEAPRSEMDGSGERKDEPVEVVRSGCLRLTSHYLRSFCFYFIYSRSLRTTSTTRLRD